MKIILDDGQEFSAEVISYDDFLKEEEDIYTKSKNGNEYCEKIIKANFIILKLEGGEVNGI